MTRLRSRHGTRYKRVRERAAPATSPALKAPVEREPTTHMSSYTMTDDMAKAFASQFEEDVFAICTCMESTMTFKAPEDGYTSSCICGKTYAMLAKHYKDTMKEWEIAEQKAVEEAKASASSGSSDFPITDADCKTLCNNKTSVITLFKDHIYPAFVNHPSLWNKAVMGDDYKELMTKYTVKYEKLVQSKRSAFLNEIRDLSDDEDKLEKLAEQIKA